jgi:uncharacterized protein
MLASNLRTLGLAASLAAAGVVGAAAEERLTMGATYSASSFYAYQVGVAGYLNETVNDLRVNVRELGGAQVSTEAMLRGEVDLSIAVTATDYAAMKGEKPFGEPADQLRTLYFFAPLPLNMVVAADSGIGSIDDLAGKSFNPGGRGSSTEGQTDLVFAALGIEPDLMRTDGSDALEAFQNRRLDGFVKAGVLPDGYIQQARASRDVAFLSMTDAQAQKIADAHPFFSKAHVEDPAEGADFVTVQTAIGITATDELDEETAYAIADAIFSDAGRKAASEVYPPSLKIDPMKLTLDAAVAPLHPGVVRWMREHGHEVPSRLLPEGDE